MPKSHHTFYQSPSKTFSIRDNSTDISKTGRLKKKHRLVNLIYYLAASDFSSFWPVPSLDKYTKIYHFSTGILKQECHAKTNFMYYKDVLNVSESD